MNYRVVLSCLSLLFISTIEAQTFTWTSSTEGAYWQGKNIKLESGAITNPDLDISVAAASVTFQGWGTCFNELGWDALKTLAQSDQDKILKDIFSPQGDLRFTLGRFSMNANDYARDWYSSDEVDGDFELTHFNIDRDKTTLIPYIKAAQKNNPQLRFWISPWSPPSWMKVNHYYSVRSSKEYNTMSPLSDVVLYEKSTETNDNVFPKQLAVNDYLIQDPRYLKAYADYFCKFISAYRQEGIPITSVMYQNEAYSYTIYPGCAWTAEGSIRFNTEYLGPALKAKHPEVSLFLGTINTNRYDIIDQILSDPRMNQTIKGVGFQWEGGQILPRIRKKYPQYQYVQTESECGWGSFDWKSAEHTFALINQYLGNGCTEYTFWNAILADEGTSGWGWKQNALIRVDSEKKTFTYTPEYYAVKHYCRFVPPMSELLSFKAAGEDKKPILIFRNPKGKYVIIAGNFNDKKQRLTVKLGKKNLSVTLAPHSLNTFEAK